MGVTHHSSHREDVDDVVHGYISTKELLPHLH